MDHPDDGLEQDVVLGVVEELGPRVQDGGQHDVGAGIAEVQSVVNELSTILFIT